MRRFSHSLIVALTIGILFHQFPGRRYLLSSVWLHSQPALAQTTSNTANELSAKNPNINRTRFSLAVKVEKLRKPLPSQFALIATDARPRLFPAGFFKHGSRDHNIYRYRFRSAGRSPPLSV